MNRVFRSIWSKALLTWVPVSEISKAHRGGSRSSRRKLKAVGRSPLMNCALAALAALSGAAMLTVPPVNATDYTTTQNLDDGSTVTLQTGDTITTYNADGVDVQNGTFDLVPGNIVTVGGDTGGYCGLLVQSANGVINSDGSTVTNNSTGTGSHGVYVFNSGTISLAGTSVTTVGADSHGLYAAMGGIITGTGNNTVITFGDSSYGVYAYGGNSSNNSSATFTNTAATPLSVTTSGMYSDGIVASNAGRYRWQCNNQYFRGFHTRSKRHGYGLSGHI